MMRVDRKRLRRLLSVFDEPITGSVSDRRRRSAARAELLDAVPKLLDELEAAVAGVRS